MNCCIVTFKYHKKYYFNTVLVPKRKVDFFKENLAKYYKRTKTFRFKK